MNLWHVQILAGPYTPHATVLDFWLVACNEDQVFDWLEEKYPGYRLRSVGIHRENVIVLQIGRAHV